MHRMKQCRCYTDICSHLVWSRSSRPRTQYTWHHQRQVRNDNIQSPDDSLCCRCVRNHMACNQQLHRNSPPTTNQYIATAHSVAWQETNPLQIQLGNQQSAYLCQGVITTNCKPNQTITFQNLESLPQSTYSQISQKYTCNFFSYTADKQTNKHRSKHYPCQAAV